MKKTHKIILVVTVCAVLFSAFATSVFADSIVENFNGNTLLMSQPICAPDFIYFGGSNDYVLFDCPITMLVPVNTGVVNGGYSESKVYNDDLFGAEFGRTNFEVYNFQTKSSSAYGYTYYPGTYHYDIFDLQSSVVGFHLTFNPCFVPSNLVNSNWNWLSNFWINDYAYGESLECDNITITYTYSYLNKTSSTNYELVTTSQKSYEFSGDYIDSEPIWNSLKERIKSEVSSDSFSKGIYLNHFAITARGFESTDGISIRGSSKWSNPDQLYRALTDWSKYYKGDVYNYHYETPTILQSITMGVDAIWNLKLFNTFTVGNIFSACVGILLTKWLLKMFAGG